MKHIALPLLTLAAVLASCSEDTPIQDAVELNQSSTDESIAQKEFEDALGQVEQGFDELEANAAARTAQQVAGDQVCATLTVYRAINTDPDTLVLDFGTEGCLGRDGRTRSGKIISVFTDRLRAPGAVVTTTFEDYFVTSAFGVVTVQVVGQKVRTNTTTDSAAPSSTLQVGAEGNLDDYAQLLFADGGTVQWKTSRTRTWVAGAGTRYQPGEGRSFRYDDVFEVYGSSQGVNRRGASWTSTVDASDPLTFKGECLGEASTGRIRYPVSGVVTIAAEGGATRTVDYGDGACDREVTVTMANGSRTVFLP